MPKASHQVDVSNLLEVKKAIELAGQFTQDYSKELHLIVCVTRLTCSGYYVVKLNEEVKLQTTYLSDAVDVYNSLP